MTRLRFDLSYLRKHKFKHRFQGCSDRDCFYCNDLETFHYFTVLPIQTKRKNNSVGQNQKYSLWYFTVKWCCYDKNSPLLR